MVRSVYAIRRRLEGLLVATGMDRDEARWKSWRLIWRALRPFYRDGFVDLVPPGAANPYLTPSAREEAVRTWERLTGRRIG